MKKSILFLISILLWAIPSKGDQCDWLNLYGGDANSKFPQYGEVYFKTTSGNYIPRKLIYVGQWAQLWQNKSWMCVAPSNGPQLIKQGDCNGIIPFGTHPFSNGYQGLIHYEIYQCI